MKYVKVVGFVWGLIYFVIGIVSSFTLSNINFWSSVALLFGLFLLPLPTAVIAVWFQRIAAAALLLCVAVSFVATGFVIASRPAISIADEGIVHAHIVLYSSPHLAFATIYILTGKSEKEVNGRHTSRSNTAV